MPAPPTVQASRVRSLRATRAATTNALPALRRLTRTWSADSALDPDIAEDLILAVDEAVTNVVEHAYLDKVGAVRLHLTHLGCGELTVTIDDDGTWRPPPGDPGFRGRGLQLIETLADHALVTHTARGTTVTMSWNAHTVR